MLGLLRVPTVIMRALCPTIISCRPATTRRSPRGGGLMGKLMALGYRLEEFSPPGGITHARRPGAHRRGADGPGGGLPGELLQFRRRGRGARRLPADGYHEGLREDGRTVIGEFALERRIPISPERHPRHHEEGGHGDRGHAFLRAHRRSTRVRLVGGSSRIPPPAARRAVRRSPSSSPTSSSSPRRRPGTANSRSPLLALQIERYSKEQILSSTAIRFFSAAAPTASRPRPSTTSGNRSRTEPRGVRDCSRRFRRPRSGSHQVLRPEAARARRDLVLDAHARGELRQGDEAEAANTKTSSSTSTTRAQPERAGGRTPTWSRRCARRWSGCTSRSTPTTP